MKRHGFPAVSARRCFFVFVSPHDIATLAAVLFVKESTAILLDVASLSVFSAIDLQRALDDNLWTISYDGDQASR